MKRSILPGLLVLCTIFAFTAGTVFAEHHECKDKSHCMNIVKMDAKGANKAICACGMEFSVTDDTPVVEYEHGKYYACSAGCAEKIKADPAKMVPVPFVTCT